MSRFDDWTVYAVGADDGGRVLIVPPSKGEPIIARLLWKKELYPARRIELQLKQGDWVQPGANIMPMSMRLEGVTIHEGSYGTDDAA